MEIKLVFVEGGNVNATGQQPEMAVLKVSGEVDYLNPVVQRAREVILRDGSEAMLESFDWALEHKSLSGGK